MILNHKTAIELLVENMDSAEFNRYTQMNLHSALAENLLPKRRGAGALWFTTVRVRNMEGGSRALTVLGWTPDLGSLARSLR